MYILDVVYHGVAALHWTQIRPVRLQRLLLDTENTYTVWLLSCHKLYMFVRCVSHLLSVCRPHSVCCSSCVFRLIRIIRVQTSVLISYRQKTHRQLL